jgi:hypothetical protein
MSFFLADEVDDPVMINLIREKFLGYLPEATKISPALGLG